MSLDVLITILVLWMGTGVMPGGACADETGESTDEQQLEETTKAPDTYSAGARIRIRNEVRDDYFDPALPGNGDSFLLTQLRAHLEYQPFENVRIFVEAQDARAFDDEGLDEDAVPNLNQDALDLHQGYLDVSFDAGRSPVRIRTGRQKMNLGAKRVISSLEWSNTAVTWDGVRTTIGSEDERSLDAFAFTGVPPDNGSFNDWSPSGNRLFDSEYAGLYYTDHRALPDGPVEGYLLYRENDRLDDEVYTFGGRFDQNWRKWDANAEVAVQTGTFGDRDHRGYAVHAGAGRSFDVAESSRLGALYDFASGDDDPGDDTHQTFDNIYYIPLNHAYYGYMDFFSWQNLHHGALTWSTEFRENWALRLAYHEFWLVEEGTDSWYNAGRGTVRNAGGRDVDDHVGTELDLTVSHPFEVGGQTVNALIGYSKFFSGGYVDDTGPSSDADFFYVQLTTSF